MLEKILSASKYTITLLIAALLFAAAPTHALATVSLEGTITDDQSNPLSGATVWTQLGTAYTNGSGYYSFSDLGTTSVAMKVTKGSYVTQMANVEVTSGNTTTKNFVMPFSIFKDGFESNSFSQWTTNNNMNISTSTKQGGSYSAEANATGGGATNLRRTLSTTYSALYYRTYFNINSQDSGSGLGLLAYRTAADGAIVKVYIDGPTGKLCTRNEVSLSNTCSTTVPAQDTWHNVELYAKVNGTSSEIKVWYNGSEVTSLTTSSADLGSTSIGRVVLGEVNSGRTFNAFFDDVALSTGRIDQVKGMAHGLVIDTDSFIDVIGATVSFSGGSYTTRGETSNFWLVGLPAGSTPVTAGWTNRYTSETHNYSVTTEESDSTYSFHIEKTTGTAWGYVKDTTGAMINGATVTISGGSPSNGTTYTSGSSGTNGLYQFNAVQPGTYTVTASKSGYVTKADSVTVTAKNSSRVDLTLPTIIFSDDFEAGNMNSWSPVNMMTAQTSLKHFGSYAAEGDSSVVGYAQYARKHFSSTHPDVYYRAYFNIDSMANNNVGLLWFRTDADGGIMKTYIDGATGKLCIRNDVASTTTCSTTIPSQDTWYLLEMRAAINGTSSTHQVWLDGTEITALSSTSANLGTSNIGRIYLGETATGRTFKFYFDDVMVQTARVGAAGGSITGLITDDANGYAAVSGATVSITGKSATSNGSGVYTLNDVEPGTYTVTASKTGFSSDTGSATVTADTASTVNIAITGNYTGSITGTVIDAKDSMPRPDIVVTYAGGSTTTNGSGVYTFSNVPDGTYSVTASLDGYYESKTESSVVVSGGAATTQNFTLRYQFIADSFESNNFNLWTTNNNMSMQSTTVHGGSYAPEGNTTGGSAMNLRKTLMGGVSTAYFRTYFYVNSQDSGSGLGLVSYRDTSDTAIIKTYIDGATGKLCIRNEKTSTNTCSNTVPTQDAWHSVELYTNVNGTSSSHKVWYDGTEETSLTSSSADLGTVHIGRLVLGEVNSGRTYDVFFDDVKALDVKVD